MSVSMEAQRGPYMFNFTHLYWILNSPINDDRKNSKVQNQCGTNELIQTNPGLTSVFPHKLYLLWCSSGEKRPHFVITVSICHSSSTLLPLQCGFFKRASKDQYDAAYHKAEIHVQPSDKDKLSAEAWVMLSQQG